MTKGLHKYLIMLSLLAFDSCSNEVIKVPQDFRFEIQWGNFWTPHHINKLVYNSAEDSLTILTHTIEDSVTSSMKYKIDRIQGDSLFVLAYHNIIKFHIEDPYRVVITDGNNIKLTVETKDQMITQSFISRPTYEVSKEIGQIISILENVTKEKELFD